MIKPHIISGHCDCNENRIGTYLSFNFEDEYVYNNDRCGACDKKYKIDVKPIPNGTAFYVYHE